MRNIFNKASQMNGWPNALARLSIIPAIAFVLIAPASISFHVIFRKPMDLLAHVFLMLPDNLILMMLLSTFLRLAIIGIFIFGVLLFVYLVAKTVTHRIVSFYLNSFVALCFTGLVITMLPDLAFDNSTQKYLFERVVLIVFVAIIYCALIGLHESYKPGTPSVMHSMAKASIGVAISMYILLSLASIA